MTKLSTGPFFFPFCSTWDRLNVKLFTARDRNNFKLIVEKGLDQLATSKFGSAGCVGASFKMLMT